MSAPYRANLFEKAVVGTIIITVTAVDGDIGTENKQVQYTLASNPEGAFNIDQTKGDKIYTFTLH